MCKTKTGILTLSAARNYGAILQVSALCKYINDNFSEAEVIDFIPKFIIGRYPIFYLDSSSPKKFIKTMVSSTLKMPFEIIKKWRFDQYKKRYCKFSQKKYKEKFDKDIYGQYIVGSDQVFNLSLTQSDLNFFLPHVKDDKKKATYAASIGLNSINSTQEEIIRINLSKFKNISIREITGCHMVSNLIKDKKIIQNIDPVFLQPRKIWSEIASKPQYKKKYILIYTFVEFEKAYNIAQDLKVNMDIVSITNSIRCQKKGVINARGVGPREFLSLIKNAEYIITDSFHGAAFSIIFEKNFSVIPYKGTSSRMKDLLNMLNLQERIVEDVSLNIDKIDYSIVRPCIESAIERSEKYFHRIYH